MLTRDEAFLAGFLLRCAHEGLPAAEITARIKTAGEGGGTLGTLANWGLWKLPVTIPLGVGAVGGAALGAGLGLMQQDTDDPTVIKRPPQLKGIQRAELIATLRQEAAAARQTAEMARRRQVRLSNPPRNPYGI